MKLLGMKPKLLFIIFLASLAAMAVTGFYAFKTSERLTALYEESDKHFKVITTAATQVVSFAKRAEGHLFIYLMLHDPADREKYPRRIKSLNENISILREISNSPQATAIINKMMANAGENLSVGNALMVRHDKAMQDGGKFNFQAHRVLIRELHDRFSQIRAFGVELTTFLINSEDKTRAEAYGRAMQLRLILLVFTALAACFTLYSGYAFVKMISTLNKEIATRIESEHALEAERDKLKDALAEIKTLSGLIPICSSCKKIRDDKGYWSQVEIYIRDRSDAQFSHSLCPECALKLYPDIYEKILT